MRCGGGMVGAWTVWLAILAVPADALAGMPSLHLSDIAGVRLAGISFFLVVLLGSALAIQWLWNALAKDFCTLPRLTYWRACAAVMLWGLLFVIVLTMISGARELMTPGAWEKQGATYRLRSVGAPPAQADANLPAANQPSAAQLAQRRLQLAELRHALDRYALAHEGRFPPSREESGIDESFWKLPDISGMRYVYVSGRTTADRDLPLAFEPQLYAGDPLVLLVGGEIVQLPRERIEQSSSKISQSP